MKHFLCLFLTFCLLFTPAFAEEPLIQPAVATAEQSFYQLSVQKGGVVELSARELEIRLGLEEGQLKGLTITALPDNGNLILDGVRLSEFSQLTREELDHLCFVPSQTAVMSGFSFIPDCPDRSTATLSVAVTEEEQIIPKATDLSLRTWSNIPIQSTDLAGLDPQTTTIHITRAPRLGVAKIVGETISYQSFTGLSGADQFCYVLMDASGNLSQEATVEVQIEKNPSNFSFADMDGRAEAASAMTAHKIGVLCGEKAGGAWYFYPDSTMTQAQFLISLLAASGTPVSSNRVIRTSLQNDGDIPMWFKPYIQAAVDKKILTESVFFPNDSIPEEYAKLLLQHAGSSPMQKSLWAALALAIGPDGQQKSAQKEASTCAKTDTPPVLLTRAKCAVLLTDPSNNFPS